MKNGQFPAILPLASLNGQNGFKLDGENTGDYSGQSISAAGDINGDGHDDLLIGAYTYPSGSNKGRSYVVFGGPGVGKSGDLLLSSLNGTNGFKLDGENNNDQSGRSVSTAGDINGDGHADLVIGAAWYPSGSAKGRSYVVFGGPGVGKSGGLLLSSLNGGNGFKLDGENNGDNSGVSVSAAGDINGDSHDDLLIGTYQYTNSSYKGRSYVVFGGPGVGKSGSLLLSSLNGTNGFKLDGENNNDYSGYSISAAGDINGDGHDDLLIGAYGYPSGTYKGRSYVVFGGPGVGQSSDLLLSSLNGTNGFKFDGENNQDGSGCSVSTTGDINGDGYADLLIGAYGYGGTGRSYVVFGGPSVGKSGDLLLSSLNGTNGFKLDGENNNDYSGYSVSTAGDINGDGYNDLLIGAYAYPSNSRKGRSYVVFGGPGVGKSGDLLLSSLNGINGFKLDGENDQDDSGRSVSAAGDINGDSVDDVLIGADRYPSGNAKGRSYVVFGDAPPVLVNNSLSIGAGATIAVTPSNLGAYDRNHNNQSLVFVLTGLQHGFFALRSAPITPVVNVTQAQVRNGTVTFSHDGSAFAPSYNVTVRSTGIAWTGPWSANVTFIAPTKTPISQGQFPAILPLASLNGQNGFKLDGENNNDFSGWSVSAAGDINGDGHADLIIGADWYPSVSFKGRSYVVFGGPGVGKSGDLLLSSLNGTNGFKLDGENNNDWSGISVSAAGDINGDGHDDLVIGAWGYPNGNGTGRSYVVFGGSGVGKSSDLLLSSLNGTNGFKLDGENNNDNSGNSVSTAGDINGDGHDDLLIGAYRYPSNSGKGRSYVVFGGSGVGKTGDLVLSSLNGSNGFKLDGENNQAWSGYSVSAVGDINGDGYKDVVIGADAYPSNSAKGRSYVVFGGPGVGKSGDLLLSSLNGTNGFKLDGENNSDYSGKSVSAAGDINGDGYADLLIGAYGYPSGSWKGRSYVVFGGRSVGKSGGLLLSSLNGTNGFKLDGENNGDYSGYSVSAAGDINGDGYADLLIGAYEYPGGSQKGRSYVMFGGPGVGKSGGLLLSSLNGTNGFKLDGENNGDRSGQSVSAAGDINGDSVDDVLIGANAYPSGVNKGRTYVVFGDVPPVLVNNSLSIWAGATIAVTPSNLGAYDRNHNNQSLVFVLTGLQHGFFALRSAPTTPVVNVTQAQVRNGTVTFSHDGSAFAPSYNVTVRSTGIAWTGPWPANITFILPTTTAIATPTTSQTPTTPTTSVKSTSTPSTAQTTTPTVPAATTTIMSTPASISHTPSTVQTPTPAVTSASTSTVQTSTPVFPSTPVPTATPTTTTVSTPTPVVTSTFTPNTVQTTTPMVTSAPMTTMSTPVSISQTPSTVQTPTPILTPTLTPTSNFTPPFSTALSSNDHSTLPILLGAVVGGLAAFAALCGGAWYYRRKKQAALKTLTMETPEEGKMLFPVTDSGVYLTQTPAEMEFAPISRRPSPLLPPPSILECRPEKSAVESLSELKISSRSQSTHISFGVSYQDLKFDEKDKLGVGAFGTVYRGTYKFNQVAIKELRAAHLSEEALVELKQEASILDGMRSDYIVEFRGICLEAPHYCLVMELMLRGSLYGLLQNSPELPLSVWYQIGLDVCCGLYHLHEKNILHRDLKSLNVLLDDRLRAKISDFGLSKVKSEMSGASSTKEMKGTLGWMAPELFAEKPQATPAADIYALGMVLWEMMIKPYRIPFQNMAFTSVLTAKVTRGEKQETIPDSCPPEMADLIKSCWQEPGKRPSAEALAKSLSTIFKASEEKPSKVLTESHHAKDEIVQQGDLLTAAPIFNS